MSDPSSAGDRTVAAVRAREVLDCRGLPTVQVDVVLDGGVDRHRRRALRAARPGRTRPASCATAATASAASASAARSRNVTGEIREPLVGAPLADQRSARRGR